MSDAPIQFHTPEEIERTLACRARDLRLLVGWKQATLAARSGVTLASLKRFERTGKASLESLLRICHALGRLEDFDLVLRPPIARSLAELEARATKPLPKRGRQ
jgi:HTH-type transcriptional regulator / antitoxin HipB